jgi:hypothetical protein
MSPTAAGPLRVAVHPLKCLLTHSTLYCESTQRSPVQLSLHVIRSAHVTSGYPSTYADDKRAVV